MLLRELAAGRESAFRQLYDHYAHRIYSVGLRHLKQADLAEDLVQSVFLKLWESRKDLGEVHAFAGWLYTLTRNTLISVLRKKGSQAAYLDFIIKRPGSSNLQPEQDLIRKEQLQLIRNGMNQLSNQQRIAFRLQREEGLSYQRIGERMGISPNTVRVHLYKAMEFLRRFVHAHSSDASLVLILLLLR